MGNSELALAGLALISLDQLGPVRVSLNQLGPEIRVRPRQGQVLPDPGLARSRQVQPS